MSELSADGTIEMRDSDRVDVNALSAWLTAARPDLVPHGAQVTVRQFSSGFSNLTFLLRVRRPINPPDGSPIASTAGTGSDARTVQQYVLRRPPHGVAPGVAHNVGREHDLLAALGAHGLAVPHPLARCDDVGVIGAPFYVMEYVDGVILRGAIPAELPTDPLLAHATLARLSHTFVNTMVALHAIDVSSSALATLGRPEGYVRRQVDGWTRRWQAARLDALSSLDRVALWLSAHQPPDREPTLLHNDFKFDNLVLDRGNLTRVAAVLDWEMATIGDPRMDLGTSLAYWVEKDDPPIFRALGLGVTALPGSMSRADVVQAYGTASHRDVSDMGFYYTFGLFKLAVIAQQIYARHRQGLTSDPRFARLGEVVAALGDAAERAKEAPGLE